MYIHRVALYIFIKYTYSIYLCVYPRSRAHFDSLLIIYKLKRLPDVCGVLDVKL